MTSLNLLISIGQLNCEETITRIYVALSCVSCGCSCSRDSVSNDWRYAIDVMDCITYLKDQNVALSWLVQEGFCKRMQHSWSYYLFCCCLPQNLNNCTDCSGCSSELLHCHGETHGLPTRPHIGLLQFLLQQAKARDSSLVSVRSVY